MSFIVPAKVTVTPELPHHTKRHKGHKGTDPFLMHFPLALPLSFTHSVLSVCHTVHVSQVFFFYQYIPLKFYRDSPMRKTRGHSGTQQHSLSTHTCHTHEYRDKQSGSIFPVCSLSFSSSEADLSLNPYIHLFVVALCRQYLRKAIISLV